MSSNKENEFEAILPLPHQLTDISQQMALEWIKGHLKCEELAIEDLSQGVQYLGLLNKFFPETIDKDNIVHNPNEIKHYIENYITLSEGFVDLGIYDFPVSLESLVISNHMYNLHFLRWFQFVCETNAERYQNFLAENQICKNKNCQMKNSLESAVINTTKSL